MIFVGEVMHRRLQPVDHHFKYGVYFYGFNLSDLPRLDREIGLFGYNRFRPVAIHDRDYLEPGRQPIQEKLKNWLREKGCEHDVEQVFLVTAARYWNYVFNPVSFYLCLDAEEALKCVVVEVNNTFRERHLYILDEIEKTPTGWKTRSRQPKAFHVSPFHDMEGEYEFLFEVGKEEIDIHVNLFREGKAVFLSQINGVSRPLDRKALFRTISRYPVRAITTMPRILGQAAKLYFGKKLKVYQKPNPESTMTIRQAKPGLVERTYRNLVLGLFKRIRDGQLVLKLPDGSEQALGDAGSAAPAVLEVRGYRFFKKLVLGGSVGFGEAFVDKDWDSPDVTAVLTVLANNAKALSGSNGPASWLARQVDTMRHRNRRNTRDMSRKNIHDHYDLGNDFYQLFLDPTMTYSCGIYRNPGDSLEQAQLNKLRRMIQLADIQSDHHVLEIGSGWGSMAIETARSTGCRVTSITLSEAQHRLATERVRAAGLADQVEIVVCDYRDVQGTFDRIVSIEMLEAVGHEYFQDYFKTLEQRLNPGGRAAIQVITIPEERYETYRKRCDWIQKYIFPGGLLPSLTALQAAWEASTSLKLESVDNIGPDYAPTLRAWCERFEARLDEVRDQGFDETFIRKWIYYLCYCEAGFATGMIDDLQFVLTKA
jgi:cyclopropane-fatty-acyl-phospholipid synthase